MRAAARQDFDEIRRIVRWPLRELLLRYLYVMREQQVEHWNLKLVLHEIRQSYAAQRLRPPMPPPLLRDDTRGDDE